MDACAMCRQPRASAQEIARVLTSSIGQVQVGDVAALAADPDAPLGARVVALAAVVDALAILDARVRVPAVLGDALDDLALVDGALAAGHAAAVCAALFALGARADLASTRKRVVRRLVAAGVASLPLAELALQIGDRAAGAAVAVRDFDARIAPLLATTPPGEPLCAAWARWLARLPDADAAALLGVRADLARLLLPHASHPATRDRLAWLAAGMLPG